MTILILGTLGSIGLWQGERTLKSDRPHASAMGWEEFETGEAFARLWQDPMRAAREAFESEVREQPSGRGVGKSLRGYVDTDTANTIASETRREFRERLDRHHQKHTPLHIIPVMSLDNDLPESREGRVSNRYAVLSALASEGYRPTASQKIKWFMTCFPEAVAMCKADDASRVKPTVVAYEFWKHPQDKPVVLVMWLPRSHFPGTEQLEYFNRLLNAVLPKDTTFFSGWQLPSFLNCLPNAVMSHVSKRCGLNRNITVSMITGTSDRFVGLLEEDRPSYSETNCPFYRWFMETPERASECPPQILNEGEASQEMRDNDTPRTREPYGHSTKQEKNGPEQGQNNSNGTSCQNREQPTCVPPVIYTLRVFDYSATIAESDLLGRLGDRRCRYENESRRACGNDTSNQSDKLCRPLVRTLASGPKLYHTIGTDEQLFKALLDEFKRRRLLPDDDRGRILLVHEIDTAYGQALPEAFKRRVGDGSDETVMSISFFRGVDGRVPGVSPPGGDSDRHSPRGRAQRQTDLMSMFDVRVASERPHGESQLDYLRRQVEMLARERDSKNRILAIGVLSTDVYDKQPIIQALRAAFPEAQFFTTDLYALFTHPESYRTMRNLLVVSHYGLRLGKELQGTVPPFRTSYQTSLFLAVKLAARSSNGESVLDVFDELAAVSDCSSKRNESNTSNSDGVEAYISARLYEIGRNGHFDLGPPAKATGLYHPPHVTAGTVGMWHVGGILILALLLCAIWMPSKVLKKLSKRVTVLRIVCATVALGIGVAMLPVAPTSPLLLAIFTIPLVIFVFHRWEWSGTQAGYDAKQQNEWDFLFSPTALLGILSMLFIAMCAGLFPG